MCDGFTNMAEFIFESGATIRDLATKKAIRSQAMRNFRERQRKNGTQDGSTSARRKEPRHIQGTFSATRPLLPAIAPNKTPEPTTCIGQRSRTRHSNRRSEDSYSVQVESQLQDLGRAIDGAEADLEEITGIDVALAQCSGFTDHHVWRQQLGYVFLTSYYADSIVSAMYKDRHNFEPGCAAGHTLNAARDALCLIHLGTRFRHERLFEEGNKRHGVALRLLRERIEGLDRITCDGLLDACYTLAHCQIYQSVSHRGKGWQIHIEGLHFLLRRRGVNSIRSPFAHATLHKIRQVTAMDQLLKRKRSFLSSPEWLISRWQNNRGLHMPAVQLTDFALQLSGALEDTDVALKARAAGKPVPGDQVQEISLHIQSLEYELRQWLLKFYHRAGVTQIPYTLTDVAEHPHFETQCSGMALLFPKVYSFPTLLSATIRCYLSILHLVISMAQLDLAGLRPTQLATNSEALAAEADEQASELCRSLAYLSLPSHRSSGALACGGPLYWASAWYERSGDSKKLQACQSVREVLESDCPAPLNLKAPVFTWWMIPSVFEDQDAAAV